jgi:tRNA pseudouridine55 synthase
VGHTGTLDPAATGLLVLLVGRATRLAPFVPAEPKVYETRILFGAETDTDDAAGDIVRRASPPEEHAVDLGIASLTGPIAQVPPSVSAKQQGGVRAYAAARRGQPLALEPSPVVVHSWELLDRSASSIRVRITCGPGTYIRALARDLGRLCGSAAHVGELRRTTIGPFTVDAARPVDRRDASALRLLPPLDAIPQLPRRMLGDGELTHVLHGRAIEAADAQPLVAAIDHAGDLVAIMRQRDGELHPVTVLRNA